MTDTITLTGLVATIPNHLVTSEALPITSFRLASAQRRFDRTRNSWIDGETNWYTITAFRQLAMNINSSIKKGDRVVVTGRLRIRDWSAPGKTGTNIEVDADAIGHDLSWGTAAFTRSISGAAVDAATRLESDGHPAPDGTSLVSSPPAAADWPTVTPADAGRSIDADTSPNTGSDTESLASMAVPF